MARLFDRAASEYLTHSGAPVTAVPLTLACWFKSSDAANNQDTIVLTDVSHWGNYFGLAADGSIGGDPVRGYIYDGVTFTAAATTTGYSTGTWHHACAVFAAVDDRAAFIDGGSKGTSVFASTPTGLDTTMIGAWNGAGGPSNYFDGSIAEAVILRIAATDYQVWLHAQGVPAPVIWPGWAIAGYWPLFETDRDFPAGNYNMSPQNTPSWEQHPPKVLEYWRRHQVRAITTQTTRTYIAPWVWNPWQPRGKVAVVIEASLRYRTAYKSQDD
jgi:hypothetical protein